MTTAREFDELTRESACQTAEQLADLLRARIGAAHLINGTDPILWRDLVLPAPEPDAEWFGGPVIAPSLYGPRSLLPRLCDWTDCTWGVEPGRRFCNRHGLVGELAEGRPPDARTLAAVASMADRCHHKLCPGRANCLDDACVYDWNSPNGEDTP